MSAMDSLSTQELIAILHSGDVTRRVQAILQLGEPAEKKAIDEQIDTEVLSARPAI